MIFDFQEVRPEGRYDCCIIGSGPAGITLALKLAGANRRVLMLEGGGEELSRRSQDVYIGDVTGDDYYPLDASRLRYFGGTSNHWAGRCRPLDAFDFEFKDYQPLASWPITKADLDPYIGESRAIVGIEEFPEPVRLSESIQDVRFNVAPVRFKDVYGPRLQQSPVVDVYLNANVTSLRTNGAAITEIEVSNWSGEVARVRADRFVLAAGGIENSRLLLWSNELANGELLPSGTPVGRYWMDTPVANSIGQAVVFDEDPFGGMDWHELLSPTREALFEDRILNCGLYFRPIDYAGTRDLIASLACVAPKTARRAAALLGKDLYCGYMIQADVAQTPLAESRIELDTQTDALGVPRVKLHWRKSAFDVRSIRRAAERVGSYLAERDIGRLHLDAWVADESEFPSEIVVGSHHHLGGTRMAESPSSGVVDPNCKVFGQDNLYIAGSSVFPVGGHVNPTFTIIQLASRLGDHLLRA